MRCGDKKYKFWKVCELAGSGWRTHLEILRISFVNLRVVFVHPVPLFK